MPSMGDSIFIFLLALMLFGPKKLPQLARQLGKLMAEFRKASNEFRMQMEDELRIEEQKEHQAKINALAPPPSETPNPDIPTEDPPHPHLPTRAFEAETAAEPVHAEPIAESGDLRMMPPSSGLPMESSARGRSYAEAAPEPTIHGGLADHGSNGHSPVPTPVPIGAGVSSEEPLAETTVAELPPPPDRSHPVMAGEGERATHV